MAKNELVEKVAKHLCVTYFLVTAGQDGLPFGAHEDWLKSDVRRVWIAITRAALVCLVGENWEEQIENLPLLPVVPALVDAVTATQRAVVHNDRCQLCRAGFECDAGARLRYGAYQQREAALSAIEAAKEVGRE